MKWDKENRAPIEGTFTPLNIPGETIVNLFKQGLVIPWEKTRARDAIEKLSAPGITFDDYLLGHQYDSIEEDILCEMLYAATDFMSKERADRLLDIIGLTTDQSSLLSGLTERKEMDVLCRLYYCESDEDVWDILLDGYGDPRAFVTTYAGIPFMLNDSKPLFPPAVTASEERLRRYVIYMASNGMDMNKLMFGGRNLI